MNKNIIYSKSNIQFKLWFKINKNALNVLYKDLHKICLSYNIILYNNEDTYNNYIRMMFNESNKILIDKKLYPEYFNLKFNSNGYQNYKIIN